jgi:hypothetical protein
VRLVSGIRPGFQISEIRVFRYTFQLGCAITDVDIKAKLDLRGTAAAKKELKDWRRSQAGTCS